MKIPSLADLYLAYRQAKTALFYERRGVGLRELSKFEDSLPRNLTRLRQRLASSAGWFDEIVPGEVRLVPKRLTTKPSDSDKILHIGNKDRSPQSSDLEVQLRLSPSPEFAIVEVLYLHAFGAKLESLLHRNVIGYRLDLRQGQLLPTRRWIFEYWPPRYREFRTAPLEAAQRELGRPGERSVIILSADLASYYDTIDASFMIKSIPIGAGTASLSTAGPLELEEYRSATSSLLGSFAWFHKEASKITGLTIGLGIPIGALTSRLIANLALAPLDEHIAKLDSLLCYRRYVDDLVVAIRAESNRISFKEALNRILPLKQTSGDVLNFDVAKLNRPGSEFQLQRRKMKVHQLSGAPGRNFLDAVGKDFGRLVSERRAFLDTAILDTAPANHFVHVGREQDSPLRVLRDADRTHLERFALSTSLRSLERVSRLVARDQARQVVSKTLESVARALDEEENWVEGLDVVLRVLRLAIATSDSILFHSLNEHLDQLWGSIESLRSTTKHIFFRNREIQYSRDRPWISLRNYLHERRMEAVCGSLPLDAEIATSKQCLPLGIRFRTATVSYRRLRKIAFSLANSDLRASDHEDDQVEKTVSAITDTEWPAMWLADNPKMSARLAEIDEFIKRCKQLKDPSWQLHGARLFLCTRPPSYFDIARRWLNRVELEGFKSDTFSRLLSVVNAIRGTEYLDPVGTVVDEHTVEIPGSPIGVGRDGQASIDPRLIIGNLVVSDTHWKSAATRIPGSLFGCPRLDFERLKNLANVISRATSAAAGTNGNLRSPAVLVLPELSIPRQWFREVANHVVRFGGFTMVAGLEYFHILTQPYVMSQAVAVLPGPFMSVATWPWTKRLPSREEAKQLNELPTPVSFAPLPSGHIKHPRRAAVRTVWGTFSVLICSELIETRRVADLLGRVELVLSPAWNKDTASYDHLIQTAGLQLHAVVAVANNGQFSDCRAWAPLATRWCRDLCRLIERDINDVVYVDLPLSELRAFHEGKETSSERCRGPRKCILMKAPWQPLPPDWSCTKRSTEE